MSNVPHGYLAFHNHQQLDDGRIMKGADLTDKMFKWLVPEGSYLYSRTTKLWYVKRTAGLEFISFEQVPEKTRLLFLIVNQ